jgi:hypothetical protein
MMAFKLENSIMIEKYFMSRKTLDMWIAKTGNNTYMSCPIEIDNSIPYGAVEHIEGGEYNVGKNRSNR